VTVTGGGKRTDGRFLLGLLRVMLLPKEHYMDFY